MFYQCLISVSCIPMNEAVSFTDENGFDIDLGGF